MAAPKFQHVRWIDLTGNGIAKEILVFHEDQSNGDIYFIPVEHLDVIDKRRIVMMLRSRDAGTYPLWEVMSNTTLGNGQNALLLYHQLVKVRTRTGQILPPGKGRGISNAPVKSLTEELGGTSPAASVGPVTAPAPASEEAPVKRGAGRPPKQQ